MIDQPFTDLEPNNIGIIIPLEMKDFLEEESGESFIEDKIQGVSVCFIWDEYMKIYKEYITQEGRALNYQLGYNHICFDVNSQDQMNDLHKTFLKKRTGVRLTLPEPSPTKQCNIVSFYKIVGMGIVEFNILE